MKVTKRPKRIAVVYRVQMVEETVSQYVCPTCKVHYASGGPGYRVTRFMCTCGQELIIEKRRKIH